MPDEILIGREAELERLRQCLNEERPQLIVLYGRRRVGKTYLIDQFFNGRFDFKLTGVYRAKKEVQLRHFALELSRQTKTAYDIPANWADAFEMLRTYLLSLPSDEKHLVFFDEMPWLDTQKSDFLPEFEYFWNDFGCTLNNLVFIACGSATSWMANNIEQNKGGLFNRQTCSIYLQPFNLYETKEYLNARGIIWSNYDIARCYMILGGIPFYLSLLRADKTLADNVDNLFFRKRAELWDEFDHLYHTLFSNSEQYIKIAEALSSKRIGLTRTEISKQTSLPENGVLSEMLENLVRSDFVRAYSFYGSKRRDTLYQLKDYYSLFYFRFIKDYHGRDEHFWRNTYESASIRAWAGLTFEQLCKDHVDQIKIRLGIAGVATDVSSWFSKGDDDTRGAQIDLLLDRRDNMINLCELKFSINQFEIDKEYDISIRNKIASLQKNLKSNKSVSVVILFTNKTV